MCLTAMPNVITHTSIGDCSVAGRSVWGGAYVRYTCDESYFPDRPRYGSQRLGEGAIDDWWWVTKCPEATSTVSTHESSWIKSNQLVTSCFLIRKGVCGSHDVIGTDMYTCNTIVVYLVKPVWPVWPVSFVYCYNENIPYKTVLLCVAKYS